MIFLTLMGVAMALSAGLLVLTRRTVALRGEVEDPLAWAHRQFVGLFDDDPVEAIVRLERHVEAIDRGEDPRGAGEVACTFCGGDGMYGSHRDDGPCPTCAGRGRVRPGTRDPDGTVAGAPIRAARAAATRRAGADLGAIALYLRCGETARAAAVACRAHGLGGIGVEVNRLSVPHEAIVRWREFACVALLWEDTRLAAQSIADCADALARARDRRF